MKKVIKMTERQLRKLISEQTSGQETNQFFKLITKQWGDLLETRSDGNKQLSLSNGDVVIFISNGECHYISKTDSRVTEGKIVPVGSTEFKLVFDDGDIYDSVTETWSDSTTPTSPKPCANQLIDTNKGSLLKFGCKTQGVKELQTLLDFPTPTGYFGKKTLAAVKAFQQKNDLKVDGVVGPDTYKSLTSKSISTPVQNVNEYYDEFNDDDDDYNELDSLFKKNFDTEDDYDGEMLRGDDEGFSNKMKQKEIHKRMKLGDTNIMNGHYMTGDRKKDRENQKRKFSGLDPLRNDTQPKPYSPIKSDDLPLDKYLEKKKMNDLDEDEDIAMLDNLFNKD